MLEWWNIPRRGWIIILGELVAIIGLGGWVYAEYLNNSYFQGYVNSLSPILVPIVSVSFGIASATVATVLYFTMRKVGRKEGLEGEDSMRRRGPEKKTVKKPQFSSSRSERGGKGAIAMMPRPKPAIAAGSGAKRGTVQDSNDDEDESG